VIGCFLRQKFKLCSGCPWFFVCQVMMGGAWFQEVFGSPDTVSEESLLAVATQAVRAHLGAGYPPSWSKVALQKVAVRVHLPFPSST
jgi:hypothetical protein